MTKVYAVYSIYYYESTIIKGIFSKLEDAKVMAKALEDTTSCDYAKITELDTRYPHCDMYAVAYEGSHYDLSDSYKLTVEESKRLQGSKVQSFAIIN